MPQELITARELGRRFSLGAYTVLKLHRAGKIPSISLSKRTVRFDPRAVEAALAAPPPATRKTKSHSPGREAWQITRRGA